jgi:hypothetical protein
MSNDVDRAIDSAQGLAQPVGVRILGRAESARMGRAEPRQGDRNRVAIQDLAERLPDFLGLRESVHEDDSHDRKLSALNADFGARS